MFLEKLELQGFKSFAQKTVLEFAPGITAIVGPNGSGKSNIADAVKWVMGEQSMKTLRSKKLEDVIFAGTDGKARLGMAEVSLCLNNEDGRMPIDYSHVVLTRRLYRSGESEYFINRNKVRLLDIQDLLASSGFGQKTYSVIGQGMIDRILSSGPREKKELFEEAAGIKQYQMKKQISLNKLNLTKQNLVHIQSLLEEILPRLRSLKRQVNKVQRREEAEKKLKGIARQYFNHVWNFLKKENEVVQKKINSLQEKEKQFYKILIKVKNNLEAIEKGKKVHISTRDQIKLTLLKEERDKLQKAIALADGRIQLESKQYTSLGLFETDRQIKKLKEEISYLNQNLALIADSLTKLELKLQEKNFIQNDVLEKIKQKQNELKFLQSKKISPPFTIKKIIARLEEIYKNQVIFFGELNQAKSVTEIQKLKKRGQRQVAEIKNLLLVLKENEISEKTSKNFEEMQATLNQLFERKFQIDTEIGEIKIKIATLKSKKEIFEKQIAKDSKELGFLNKKIQYLKEKLNQNNLIAKIQKERKELIEKEKVINQKIEALEKLLFSTLEEKENEKKQIFDYERNYRQVQEELNKLKDSIRSLEIDQARISTAQRQILDEIKEIFSSESHLVIKEFDEKPEKLEKDQIAGLKQEIADLKKQIIQIGNIDQEILVEYRECEKRYNFLFEQKKDLESAIISLKKVIVELNRVISEKFEKAFKNIDGQFQKYFKILFGGGRAKLIKAKFENDKTPAQKEEFTIQKGELLSDVYIDVKATPPGKRLVNLNMLSGGEKALTSIALILAIIDNNPSPFIILDEVDAALDEANSVRYARILNSVARKTQFITITHNRETMKYANAIYGVTMEESGITKLLSVKLENIPLGE